MVKEAELRQEEDKKLRERVEARNGLENVAYQMRNSLRDEKSPASKLSDEDKVTVEKAVKDVIDWLDEHQTPEKDECDEKQKALEQIVHPIFAKVYSGQQQQAGGFPGAAEEEMPAHDEL